jgi:8-oxo-dGTP diphosphatase
MSSANLPTNYDPASFPALAVTTDVVALTARDAQLHVLLVRRTEQPALGKLALPGTFVGVDEELHAAAQRALRLKAGVEAPVRQFQTFGGVNRDPRMRIVSVAYLALLTFDAMHSLINDERQLVRLGGDTVRGTNGRRVALPFDHAEIIAAALANLRADLDHSDWAFGLLPPEFSLRELQQVHEAIRGCSVNKPAFRKRLLDSGKLAGTGRRETDKGFRPAELYRLRGANDAR